MRALITLILLSICSVAGAQTRFTCQFRVVEDASGQEVVSGKAFVQDSCYRFESPGGALYCNGKDRWIYYSESQELVIQKNDLSMLDGIDLNDIKGDNFTVDYSGLKIYLSKIEKVDQAWPATFFIIDPESFGPDTVITDLR